MCDYQVGRDGANFRYLCGKDDLSPYSSTTPLCIRWCMFLLFALEIRTEYLLKMRLLAKVDTTGKAVERAHALMYRLVHVPVA